MHSHSGRRYRAYPTPGQAERLTGWGHPAVPCGTGTGAAPVRLASACSHCPVRRAVPPPHRRPADLPWLADLPAQSAQQVLRQLDRAYDNWWNPEHPAQAPTFRKRSGLSIPFPGQAVQVRKCSPQVGLEGVRPSPNPPHQTACRAVGVDSEGRSAFVSDEREPRLMPWTLTAGQRRRACWGWSAAKPARSLGPRSTTVAATPTGCATPSARSRGFPSAAGTPPADFTHKLTTDLAKNHGRVAVGCPHAPPAAMSSMRILTPHETSTTLPPGRRSTARAVTSGGEAIEPDA